MSLETFPSYLKSRFTGMEHKCKFHNQQATSAMTDNAYFMDVLLFRLIWW